ncbi:MAG: sialidase family protein [Candidatus Thorarchaeota archaeon]|nr:sialidase family protein [Candidatus Thorarchaeota archaeon]
MSGFQILSMMLIALLLGSAIPTFASGTPFVQAQTENMTITGFSENLLLSTRDSPYAHHVEPTIAISDNGTLFAGWKNSETHNGGGARVSVVKSVDGGDSWTDPYNMDMFGGEQTRQSDPWLVWHDGSIYYAYLEFSAIDPDFTQMTVARSGDYGDTWNLVEASNNEYFADKETMVIAEDGTIYVAYDDADTSSAEGNVTLRVTRSTDGGVTFEEVGVIGWPDPGHVGPYLALNSEGHLFAAWTWIDENLEGNIYLAKSTDRGETFDTPRLINPEGNFSYFEILGGRPGKSTLPVIRFDESGRLYILWADKYEAEAHSFDIYMRISLDDGETWTQRYQVNPLSIGDQWQPDMDIGSDGLLHIVYYSETFGEYRPFYIVANMTGDEGDCPVFSDPIEIANASTSSDFTRPGDYFTIRLDQDDIPHIVWSDGRNDEMDIYYAHGIIPEEQSTIPVPDNIIIIIVVASIVVIAAVAAILTIRKLRT